MGELGDQSTESELGETGSEIKEPSRVTSHRLLTNLVLNGLLGLEVVVGGLRKLLVEFVGARQSEEGLSEHAPIALGLLLNVHTSVQVVDRLQMENIINSISL